MAEPEGQEPKSKAGSVKDLLLGAPRDLWVVIVVVLLESLSYFCMSFIFVLMLEKEYGMDDVGASGTYALFGIAISVYAILFGWVVDKLMVRRSMLLYAGLGVLSKALLGLVPSEVTLWLVMLGPLSFALSIGGTAVLAAIRRYTTANTRNVAFSVRYIAMNVGALLADESTLEGRPYLWLGVRDPVPTWGELKEEHDVLATETGRNTKRAA